jgi:hypothetical protein
MNHWLNYFSYTKLKFPLNRGYAKLHHKVVHLLNTWWTTLDYQRDLRLQRCRLVTSIDGELHLLCNITPGCFVYCYTVVTRFSV